MGLALHAGLSRNVNAAKNLQLFRNEWKHDASFDVILSDLVCRSSFLYKIHNVSEMYSDSFFRGTRYEGIPTVLGPLVQPV